MQGIIPINWNIYSLVYVIFSIANIIPLSIIAYSVYRKDKSSKVNQLFTLAVISMIQTFLWFPVGGILWDVFVFGDRLILFTTRLFQFSSFFGVLAMYWCSRVLRDGEYTWACRRNLLIIAFSLIIYIIAMMTPDAVYIVNGPPNTNEIDTGEGFVFQLVFYPGTTILIIASVIQFWQTYSQFRRDDSALGHQALMLSIGLAFGVLGMAVSFLSTLFVAHYLTLLLLAFMTAGVFVMSFGFSKESGLLKMKITNELKRLIVLLERGKTFKSEAQLAYLTNLVEREGSLISQARLLVLEGIIRTVQSELPMARTKLEAARKIAENNSMQNTLLDIERHMKHLEIQETATSINDRLSGYSDSHLPKEELSRALEYLDRMIELRETES